MPKRVLDVGQCSPDHHAIRSFLAEHFDVEVVQTHGAEDSLEALRTGAFDLVLVNRKLDRDYSEGLDVLSAIKADPSLVQVPVMLVTNFPENQAEAVAAGAEPGFGKLQYEEPETLARLNKFLG